MGSPSYMAPEQASGKTKQAGPAVDTYAIGATLYELLTGRPPFRGTTALETIEQVKTIEPVPPSRLVPKLPRDIETICLKCLQKEPAKRYEERPLLAEDLRRFQAGDPIVGAARRRAERAWRWCRRNPVVASLAGAVAAALVVRHDRFVLLRGAGAPWRSTRTAKGSRSAGPRGRAIRETDRANQEARRAQDSRRLSERRLYIAEMNLAFRAWHDGNTQLVADHLDAYRPKLSRARPICAASSGTTSTGSAARTFARCAGTPTTSWEWPLILWAAGWSPRAKTARSRSGTRRPAGRSAP